MQRKELQQLPRSHSECGFSARVDVCGMRFMSIGSKEQVMIKELRLKTF